jgi:hypothetical protein
MIYVVEFPHQGRARAWFAFSRDDFARKVYGSDSRKDWEIFDVLTMRELLDMLDRTPESAGVGDEFPAVCELAAQHGWDTPLYRAVYLLGEGVFQSTPVSESDACAAALRQRHQDCYVYWSDTEATAAMEGDPRLVQRAALDGRDALRDQLVALEILEGPIG